MNRPKIKPGDHYFKLTVLERAGSQDGRSTWRLRCDCGNLVVRKAHNLRRDKSSCGCSHPQHFQKGRESQTLIHGGARRGEKRTPLYNVWQGMKRRCNNPNNKQYADYGGRGIKVCNEWKDDYPAFASWAREAGYEHGLQIDRIDNDGPYAPGNCRFVTQSQNQRNRRPTVWITVHGERMTALDAAKRFGVDAALLRLRLRRGERPEDAIRDMPERRSRKGIKWGMRQAPRVSSGITE